MGKVQDTISRLNQRGRPQESPRIALIIPPQQQPSSHSFPTTFQAVSNWVSAQIAKSFDTRLDGLIKGLQHSNRLTNAPEERLKIMDLFATEIQRTEPRLTERYTDVDLPYSLSAQSSSKQAITLLTELSFGYKIALVDVLLGRGKLTQKLRVHAIYYSMKSIAECGLRHSQSYTPWPDKSWRDLNTLLLLAEHEKALDFPVEAATGPKQLPATIRRLYGAIARFSLSRVERLKPQQMGALFLTLNNDRQSFQLLSEKPQNENNTTYSVALNSATAPAPDKFCQYAQHHQIRYFTAMKIYAQTTPTTEHNTSVSLTRTDFNKLNNVWSQTSQRKHARAIRHSTLYTQRNLTAITASLKSIAQETPLKRPLSNQWTLINESAGGLGLLSTNNGNCSARVGDLIAWRSGNNDPQDITYVAGIVRWIKSEGANVLRVGVETIGQSVRNISLSKPNKFAADHESPIDALLCKDGTTASESSLVLLPPDKYTTGETFRLVVAPSKRESLVRLADKLHQQANFDCFVINEVTI